MRNQTCIAISLVFLLLNGCHKRSPINADDGRDAQPVIADPPTPTTTPTTVVINSPDWKAGTPQTLVGNWASSLFQDQRCTVFYTFAEAGTAELNLVCLNAKKMQFEREFRRYLVDQYPNTQQLRFKQTESSCPGVDTQAIKAEGMGFLFALETKPDAGQPQKLALWEPDAGKSPLNLSKSDGLMVEGFPAKTGTYLGMPILSGCFADGLVSNFQATP